MDDIFHKMERKLRAAGYIPSNIEGGIVSDFLRKESGVSEMLHGFMICQNNECTCRNGYGLCAQCKDKIRQSVDCSIVRKTTARSAK